MKLSEAYAFIRTLTDEQMDSLFELIEEGIQWDRCWEDVLIEAIIIIKGDK
jgi:hypothetical protein